MPPAPKPLNEAERIAALHSYDVLDTACEESFDSIARLAARITNSPVALVSLIDTDRQWFKARHGFEPTETHRDLAFCAHALLDPSRPMVVPDATADPRFADNALVTGGPEIRFYAGVPLVNQDGFALGTLCIIDTERREIEPEVLETLVGLAQTVTTTLELRRAMRQVRLIAMTDGLTGLANRAAFFNALAQAIARQKRDGRPFALLNADLDGFKRINDLRGHAVGDHVLTEAAAALRSCVRRDEMAARIGGDEFGALLAAEDGSEAPRVAERIRASIEDAMCAGGWAVTVSVGAVTFFRAPEDESEALEAADLAMYEAKAAGKNRVRCREFRGSGRMAPGIEGTVVPAA